MSNFMRIDMNKLIISIAIVFYISFLFGCSEESSPLVSTEIAYKACERFMNRNFKTKTAKSVDNWVKNGKLVVKVRHASDINIGSDEYSLCVYTKEDGVYYPGAFGFDKWMR